jgi:phosphoribosylaminoimidazole-succinocarboxamide synthase
MLLSDQLNTLKTPESIASNAYQGLSETDVEDLGKKDVQTYSGKVRDLIHQGDELLIIHSDRLSAFDKYVGLVPYKGTILTDVAEFWLKQCEKIIPTHLRGRIGDRILKVEKMEPVKAEVIVRGYLAGSMMRAYEKGERVFCGVTLPEGLTPWCKLPTPIITPTTKAEAFEHDENVTAAELIASGVCTEKEWNLIAESSLKVFELGTSIYGDHGWILVDTKYEFGRTSDGTIKIIDEVHTPDSSRLWVKDSYEAAIASGDAPKMLDKENVRRYLLDQGFSGEGDMPVVPADQLVSLSKTYLQVAEGLRGKALEIDPSPFKLPQLN